jgi:hypothetical protein
MPRRLVAIASLLLALIAPALAQSPYPPGPPPPVPALPDSARQTSYTISGTTCACSVGFQLYGTSTDYQSWVEVFLNGVQVAYNDPTYGWAITSPSGSLSVIPRPITDAVLTFNNAQTGTVVIVGAERPRRAATFSENQGVPARALNQALNDLYAIERETWDKTNDLNGRGFFFAPGNQTGPMPAPSVCVNAFLGFDGTGLNPLCEQVVSAGSLATPGSTTNGDVATWAGTNGKQLGDSGFLASSLLSGPGSSVSGDFACWNGTTAKLLKDCGGAVNSQSGNYTIGTPDCNGMVIETGALQTLTVPSASTFPNNCFIIVKNGNTGNAQKITGPGLPADLDVNPSGWCGGSGTNCLAPYAAFAIKNNGGTWETIINPGRYRQSGSVVGMWADPAGNNSNDCLTPSTACTPQQAINIACYYVDWAGTQPGVFFNSGTYTVSSLGLQDHCLGTNKILLEGNPNSPGTPGATLQGSGNLLVFRDHGILIPQDFFLQASSGNSATGLYCQQGGVADVSNVTFGNLGSGGVGASAANGCLALNLNAGITFAGGGGSNASSFLFSDSLGVITWNANIAVSGTWTTSQTCLAQNGGLIKNTGSFTMSGGTVTGSTDKETTAGGLVGMGSNTCVGNSTTGATSPGYKN